MLFISGQVSRAKSAQTVAIGSMPKPYSPADMVKAVDYLLALLRGDDTLTCPIGLEVFCAGPRRIAFTRLRRPVRLHWQPSSRHLKRSDKQVHVGALS